MNKNINPKSLKGKDIFNRTLELMDKLTPINESVINSSLEFVKRAPNGLTYTIIRENRKYFIKSTEKTEFKISELDYIGGLQNKMDESYNSYEEALKHLNMKFQQLNEMYGNKSGINSFEIDEVEVDEVDSDEQEDVKDRKYKLKIKSDSTETETPPSDDMGEMEPSGEMETPEISDAPADSDMGEMEPSGEMEMGGEDTGEMEPSGDEETGETEMGGEEDEIDIDIEEEEDPKKYIQKLTGRLGQKLRELSEVDPKLEKYVINSIISALHVDKMDKKDRIDIMKKFKKKKGMESVMTESYDMDEYYGMTSLDGPFNFEKLKSRVSDENQMRSKSIKHNKPMRFKKYELDMDSDEQWQVPLATAIGSGIGSYFANKDEGMDEELHGGQRKLDLNKNGKLDSEDFKMLRMKKKKSSDEGMGEFEMDDRKKRLADALKRIKNKRQSNDERFGAYDDIKFRSAKDEFDGGDRGTETIDPDIEIEEPLTPPKPKYPDPFNPEIPDTYPQPKAEKTPKKDLTFENIINKYRIKK